MLPDGSHHTTLKPHACSDHSEIQIEQQGPPAPLEGVTSTCKPQSGKWCLLASRQAAAAGLPYPKSGRWEPRPSSLPRCSNFGTLPSFQRCSRGFSVPHGVAIKRDAEVVHPFPPVGYIRQGAPKLLSGRREPCSSPRCFGPGSVASRNTSASSTKTVDPRIRPLRCRPRPQRRLECIQLRGCAYPSLDMPLLISPRPTTTTRMTPTTVATIGMAMSLPLTTRMDPDTLGLSCHSSRPLTWVCFCLVSFGLGLTSSLTGNLNRFAAHLQHHPRDSHNSSGAHRDDLDVGAAAFASGVAISCQADAAADSDPALLPRDPLLAHGKLPTICQRRSTLSRQRRY